MKRFLRLVGWGLVSTLMLHDAGWTDEPPVIGAILPLTGSAASLGESVQKGIQGAITNLSSRGRAAPSVIYEDSGGDPARAVATAKKLVETEGAHMIVGPVRSSEVLAMAPFVESRKIILITPTASTTDISAAGDFVFRTRESGDSHGEIMAEFLVSHGMKTVATLCAESANSITYENAFSRAFVSKGGVIASSAQYMPGPDFRSQIVKAIKDRPAALYLSTADGTDAGRLVKQVREAGFHGLIVGTPSFLLDEFLLAAGPAAEGVVVTFPIPKEAHSRVLDALAANGFDAVMLLADATERCGKTDTKCIRDFLYNVKDYDGLGGRTSFDANGDVLKPLALYEVRKGKFERR